MICYIDRILEKCSSITFKPKESGMDRAMVRYCVKGNFIESCGGGFYKVSEEYKRFLEKVNKK